jgi:hypothetical protein
MANKWLDNLKRIQKCTKTELKFFRRHLFQISKLIYNLFQVNETLLRLIVSQPSENNYVYAGSYDSLGAVEIMLLNKTCTTVTAAPLLTDATTAAAAMLPTTEVMNQTSKSQSDTQEIKTCVLNVPFETFLTFNLVRNSAFDIVVLRERCRATLTE